MGITEKLNNWIWQRPLSPIGGLAIPSLDQGKYRLAQTI